MTTTPRRGVVARSVILLLAVLSSACSSGGVDDREFGEGRPGEPEETVVQFVGADKVRLSGTFTVPVIEKAEGVPGVLFVPDISRTDRNGTSDLKRPDPLYADLSRAFTDAGIATFRYDRRGVGLSGLPADQQRLEYDDLVEDARAAFEFLAQRKETTDAPLAVVGFDTGGLIALRLAASDSKIKSVVLISTPGRPLVEVMSEGFGTTNGPSSGEAFRQEIDTLLTTGSLPGRDEILPEHQPVLPPDQEGLLRSVYSLDPLAEARAVQVPALVVAGNRSTTATPADAERLATALSSAEVAVMDTVASLYEEGPDLPPPVFDPQNDSTHTGGARPHSLSMRNQAAVSRITAFLADKLGAKRL